METPVTYPVHEMFFTFQGEGVYMGQPAFFVRTYGCPVHCPFCDSAGTWHPSWIPNDVKRLTPEQITQAAMESGAEKVVITGGEPAIFDLRPLTRSLHSSLLTIHLETSGAFEINGELDWVTVSPKRWKPPVVSAVLRADEFKFIIETPADIAFYEKMIRDLVLHPRSHAPIWLHPEWSQRSNSVVLQAISEAVKQGSGTFRAGWQIHKCYQVDSLDARSRPLVPLGGRIEKGY